MTKHQGRSGRVAAASSRAGRPALGFVTLGALAAASCIPMMQGAGYAPRQAAPAAGAVQAPPSGPKLWVGVMEFENRAPNARVAEWQIGTGMADQLVTALVQAGRFNVLERERLQQIMKEQDFAQTDRAAEGEFAQTGQLLRCQYLIRGVITEFQYEEGKQGSGLHTPWGVTLGGSASYGYVAVDLRMVDTSSGQVVSAVKAEGRAQGQWVSFSVHQAGWGFGSSNFAKTPIGQAVRACIDHAVKQICEGLAKQPYYTVVLAVEEGKVLLAGGREVGMSPGLRFVLKSRKPDLVNPVTGERIARYERAGMIQVESVEDQFSTAVILEGSGFKRGDRAELSM